VPAIKAFAVDRQRQLKREFNSSKRLESILLNEEGQGLPSWRKFSHGGPVDAGIGGLIDPGMIPEQQLPPGTVLPQQGIPQQDPGPQMSPEQTELYEAATIALSPNSPFTPDETQAILAAFDEEFGPGSANELEAMLSGDQGQAIDNIPAMLTEGEYVIPKSDVELASNIGNNEEGVMNLDRMFRELRQLKTGSQSLPPQMQQGPLAGGLV